MTAKPDLAAQASAFNELFPAVYLLVWLTDAGSASLERDREVLSTALVATAMAAMTPVERAALFTGIRALLREPSPRRRR